MNESIQALLIEPGKNPQVINMENNTDAVEHIIGGKFDAYFLMPDQVLLLHRQNGENAELPTNRKNPCLPGYLYGAFLLCGLGKKGGFASISSAQLHDFQTYFALPSASPKEYMLVGTKICITPNELLLAAYNLWDDLAPGESVMVIKCGLETEE